MTRAAAAGDLVTAENVSGLAIGTWVEWPSTRYGRVSATKTSIDTWVGTWQGQTFCFRDADMNGARIAAAPEPPEPVATILAAELERLREIERCVRGLQAAEANDAANLYERAATVVGWRAALTTALGRKCS